jgi:hypothetical protein
MPFSWPVLPGLSRQTAGSIPLARLVTAAAVVVGLIFYVSAFRLTWIDDAYIQLRYARTLLESGTWGFYAGYPANTATAPLNVLLIAIAGFPLGSVERAVTVLTALELAGLLVFLLRLSRRLFRRDFFGWFAFLAIAANPLLLSTIGMESLLYALLFVAALVCFVEDRWTPMAVALGLLTLARPDGVVWLAVLLPLAAVPLRRKATVLLVYAATIAPWFLFSWVVLGSFVPDTLVIKVGDQAWGATSFADGLGLYLGRFPLETLASLFLAPLCIFPLWQCGPRVVKTVTVLAAYGILHFVLYATLGVPPYHWYFVHQLVPMLLIASIGAAYYVERFAGTPVAPWLRAAIAVPVAGLLMLVWDEGLSFDEAPINTNWATGREYEGLGAWMRDNVEPTQAVRVIGEIGTVAYYSDRYMVNEFSDMSITDGLIAEAGYTERPGIGRLFAFNFLWRRAHQPLPTPAFEFVPVPHDDGFPRCPLDDPACRTVQEGTSDWVGRKWMAIRIIVQDPGAPPPLPPPPLASASSATADRNVGESANSLAHRGGPS